jgi:copper transport protein
VLRAPSRLVPIGGCTGSGGGSNSLDAKRDQGEGAMRLTVACTAALLASLTLAATAFGHAELLRTDPADGRTLERSPRAVVLTFSEAIDPALVRLEVRDAAGRRVHRGGPFHPDGREHVVAVALARRAEGTLVARYRVISDDGHPVAKSLKFRVRPRPTDEEQAAPPAGETAPPAAPAPKGEIGHVDTEAGNVTQVAFAAARGLGYLAIALAIGGALFLFVAWLPGLAQVAGGQREWLGVSTTFARRLRQVVLGAVAMGLLASATSIVLEAATAAGVSFWAAFDRDLIDSVSSTRPVEAWSVRIIVWLVLGAVLMAALRPRRVPVLRPTVLGSAGAAIGQAPSRLHLLVFGALAIGLALTAPMAGHTGDHDPAGLLMCTDTMHVLCMSAWLGGLVMLLVVLGLASRRLPGREGTQLMAVVVGRFSILARFAVLILLLTGVTQSVALVGSVGALLDTEYGLLVLAKIVLLALLIALGGFNQRWALPQLRRLADGGEEPGRAAAILRQSVALEVGFALVVIAVTSVLVATEPVNPD